MNHYAVENLFGIEGLNIAWYGIIITFGMILGFMLALRRCKKTGVEPDHLYNLVLWLIPVCILCARAYYVLFEWEQYKDNLLSVFQINKGGIAIYGWLVTIIGALGLSMAFLAISYAMNNPLIKPFSEGAIVVSFATLIVPLFDVVRVVRIRYFQHKPLFMPDQNHIHHKFLRVGMSHYVAMILILALALFFSFFNIVAVEYISNNIVIFIDIVLWIAFHLWLDRRELIRAKHGVANN